MSYTNNYDVHRSIVEAVTNDTYDTPKEGSISVTTLIGPPYLWALRNKHRGTVSTDVSTRLWSLLGSAVHTILERSSSSMVKELRLSHLFNTIEISGKADIYDPVAKSVDDFKVTSKYQVKDEPKPEWVTQLNILGWLFKKHGFEVKRLQIIAILRDLSPADKYTDRFPDIPFVTIPIPLWSTEKVESYLMERTNLFIEYSSYNEFDLARRSCSMEDRWNKGNIYAVKKIGAKNAYRLIDNRLEAEAMVARMGSTTYTIEDRVGKDERCENYCDVKTVCPFAIRKGY